MLCTLLKTISTIAFNGYLSVRIVVTYLGMSFMKVRTLDF